MSLLGENDYPIGEVPSLQQLDAAMYVLFLKRIDTHDRLKLMSGLDIRYLLI